MKLVRTMIFVTASFAFCWTPVTVYDFMLVATQAFDYLDRPYFLSLFIGFANICGNPFIYGAKHEDVRRALIGWTRFLRAVHGTGS